MSDDTIFALSTGGLPSAIAVLRMSGPQAGETVSTLAGALPAPRTASLRLLRDPGTGDPIDRALVLWFPGPETATGEDVAEFHIHGSRAVAARLRETLGAMAGLRAAEAGEFTRRAFLNGRMDLAAAEGLGDLLEAETEAQRRHALRVAEGGLGAKIGEWRDRLLGAEARLEAVLNFSDEGDVDEGDERFALELAESVQCEMQDMLDAPPAERLRDGVRVVLAGPPNVGKSTLFNALVAREAAIVSPTAGTTRDVIEAPVDMAGIPMVLCDTAGLRLAGDDIEEEGVRRARDLLNRADIVLWLGAAGEAPQHDRVIELAAKADIDSAERDEGVLVLSAVSGVGMAALRDELVLMARNLLPGDGEYALNARHRDIVREAAVILTQAESGDWILLSETLRQARRVLDRLTGESGVEDMLDALFGRFCIGK
ncbi:tRNA uridine-5-carboxymethylaminomethyl(34) synthesis GTPase MnmE [uncultured Parasphingopyxis sp.]|uniref:tRNA uridine-5-carboxymethylaminomethyl(34) synthesis GTPase MnmE n=1 Tax=uncultured Parasphingopyxis sp. TaxID=1547918 RepID=UPI002613F631|nr:tRNA uridine-5-carboxymethylaminomethyl(34) synthesis GTPase MnmE [uncultured Parasphingopyxis sp.]